MNYISSKEIANVWGISPTRVTILAKQGRITGARQMGREWLIPKNAQKPEDPRKLKEKKTDLKYHFPFFLYNFRDEVAELIDLSLEERRLYNAQRSYVRGKLKEASSELDAILASSHNRYVIIGALITRGFTAIELCQISIYEECLQKLKYIFAEDFDHKEELIYFYKDLESYAQGSELWAARFKLLPGHKFPIETVPYLSTNIAYTALINLAIHNTPVDTSCIELSCLGTDDRGYFFASQMIHIFLSGIYFLQGESKHCHYHFKCVLDTAIKYDSYYPIAIASNYLGSMIKDILVDYPKDVQEKIKERCDNFHSGVDSIYKCFSSRTELLQLTQRDYEYILFAMQRMTNKEIAYQKGISEPTVSKYYSNLYAKVGVINKKELVEKYKFTILA